MSFLDEDDLYESARRLVSDCVPKLPAGEKLTIKFYDRNSIRDKYAYFIMFFSRPDGSFSVSFGPPLERLSEVDSSVAFLLAKSGWSRPDSRRLRPSFQKAGLHSRLDIEQAFEEAVDGLLCATVMGTPVAIGIREIELVRKDLSSLGLFLKDPRKNVFTAKKMSGAPFRKTLWTRFLHQKNLRKSRNIEKMRLKPKEEINPLKKPPFYSGLIVLKDHQQMPLCLMEIDPELNEVNWFNDEKWVKVAIDDFGLRGRSKDEMEPIEISVASRIFPEAFRSTPDSGGE